MYKTYFYNLPILLGDTVVFDKFTHSFINGQRITDIDFNNSIIILAVRKHKLRDIMDADQIYAYRNLCNILINMQPCVKIYNCPHSWIMSFITDTVLYINYSQFNVERIIKVSTNAYFETV